ncbi:Polyphenol oxidase [Paraburkholderia caffeinitolerans]|uniref:Purine nucleoside phosphorylase n=1 Tax=Paraburkholderia caffeinitolerans TaxID=1723730 RepID=A0A6J5FGH0_9BURK|nr:MULTISPECIES: peptidoglycan editing factor PgeF [Paraburkholderia]CAB3779828.1 Polyphenol oxidase [Paraburkholderia caffeinitolerans]
MTTCPELTSADLLHPEWHVTPRVRAIVTTRNGGVSLPPFGRWQADEASLAHAAHEDGVELPCGLNLGRSSGDDLEHVEANRARLLAYAGVPAAWLKQIHGPVVVDAAVALEAARAGTLLEADASVTNQPGIACTVMVADCMPVLLCDGAGRAVGAAHAGWRGLAAGVIEKTAQRVATLAGCAASELHAYLGPAIGPKAFEVGEDVRTAFMDHVETIDGVQRDAVRVSTAAAFVPRSEAPGKYLADLERLARLRLAEIGVTHISGGGLCTFTDRERFYSYRRERVTGRMAALIWLAP